MVRVHQDVLLGDDRLLRFLVHIEVLFFEDLHGVVLVSSLPPHVGDLAERALAHVAQELKVTAAHVALTQFSVV